MDSFDPYQKWLGIPSQMRPLNHYILLGIRIFESDQTKIAAAYDARMILLKTFQSGPRGELSEEVMLKIAKAKRDLLSQERKSKYDTALKKLLHDRQRQLERDDAGASNLGPSPQSQPNGDAPSQSSQDLPAVWESSASESSPVASVAKQRSTADASVPVAATPASQTAPQTALQATSRKDSAELIAEETGRQSDQVAQGGAEEEDDGEVLSVFSYLTDIRYLVALLTISVVVMTVTVKLLSPAPEPESQTLPVASQTEIEPVKEPEPVDPLAALPRVQQAGDASFELPVQQSHLTGSGVNSGSKGITGWAVGDQAAWMLVVKERRTGYFNCLITYRAKSESTFEIQLGNRKPRPFTFYPHEDDFEEEFIVRLGKASKTTNQQALLITSVQSGAGEVEIKRIRLVPNR